MPGNILSLTAANAVITLSITGLFPVPQQLQGFSADNIYDVGQQDQVETAMGVDGKLSGGFVFQHVEQAFLLQSDSESNAIFEQWAQVQRQVKDVYVANGQTTLPSVRRVYVSTKGYLTAMPPMPQAARILQPRRYVIRWESVVPQPIGA